jgi:tRNA A22 N-methylase
MAPGEVDGVILAGLGGRTIARILESRPDVVAQLDFIVTCPSHLEADIRPALQRLGFGIADERIVFDRGRFYEVVVARQADTPDCIDLATCDDVAAAWGPHLLARDPLMAAFLDDHKRRFHAAFASKLASYRDGPKAELGRKLALLDAASDWLHTRPPLR